MIRRLHALAWCVVILFSSMLWAQENVFLLKDADSAEMWTSYNGQEFPGATVKIGVDEQAKHNNSPSLRIDGDFTKGGNYVEASVPIDADIGTLSFWIKYPGREQLTIRLIDGTKQCHQINLKIAKSDDWQHVTFPVAQFFAKRGQPDAVQGVNKYESWGGAADGKWHAPAASFHVLIGKTDEQKTPSLWLSDVTVSTQAAMTGSAAVTLPMEEVVEGEPGWNLSLGEEFKGAKGTLTVEKDQPDAGKSALKLSADFTGGGAYVETGKDLKPLGLLDLSAVKLRVKSDNVKQVTVRMIDGTGQVHQAKNIKINPDGKWHELSLKPSQVAGGEHWAGANDGKWHGAPQYFSIIVPAGAADDKAPSLLIASGVVEGTVPAKASAAAYTEAFENEVKGWDLAGASVDKSDAFKSKQSLVLKKAEDALNAKIAAVGPAFPVTPGQWQIKFSAKSDLTSMDNSYAGGLYLDLLDAGGATIKSVELVNMFKTNAWKPLAKQVDVPAGVSQARFRASINKETPGSFWIDELSASAMVVVAKDERIKRLMFTTSELGNLLFPNSSREVKLTVLADKPIPEAQRKVRVVVKDYWGAEQADPIEVTLTKGKNVSNFLAYEGKLDLSKAPLQVGRYYELHAQIDRGEGEPFRNYSSLAILPEAPANAFKPEEIPFTSRNWDNRIEEYVRLTHRLGIRICGVWGSVTPDGKTGAPQLKLIEELGMGWLTGSPAHQVEQRGKGWEAWQDEAVLRAAMRKFIADFGHVRPMIINLGNEPHDKGDAVKIPIEAYRVIYDEVKKIDPTIKVVGTSVGPEEDWFKHGMGKYLDAYDFHVYEDAFGVRKILEQRYPALFAKYGEKKPIWSTELGLNSQGLARQTVASEIHKKFTNFFAGGGECVSWFALVYPDSDGSNHDSFGSAHNTFDCRYNKYAPKLDAIAYYYSVNTILNKKYVTDKVYNENTRVFLFRNAAGDSLVVAYKDKGRDDVFIPLEGVSEVEVTRLDGQKRLFDANGRGITLTINEDPVLLTYKGGPNTLPNALGKPAIALGAAPASIVRTEKSVVDVIVNDGAAENVTLTAQPFWTVQKESAGNNNARFVLVAPAETNVRELDTSITLNGANGKPVGEIYYRPAVTGTMSIELIPVAFNADKPAAVKLVIRNNSPSKQDVAWDITLTGEQQVKDGQYGDIVAASAYFADTPSGVATIEGKQQAELVVPLAEAQKTVIYRVKATAKDSTGRVLIDERPMAGFVSVPKSKEAVTLDGKLDEAVWQKAPIQKADQREQFFAFLKKENQADWKDAKDLSADIRFAWDEQNLYLGVQVTDDIAGPVKPEYDVWQQDGLQMLIDPMRTSNQKVGKYDYAVGENAGQHRVKCYLAADGSVQLGDVTTWKVSTSRSGAGNITYEIAIPWGNVLPFKPAVGANLGLTLIMNEDDGNGRDAFMTWFGNAHNKDIDKVGDLILAE